MTENAGVGGRVLIVDDHLEMAEGLADYLRGHDYVVETASSGAQAVEMVGKSAFDAVITDLRMKDMDGMGVLDAVLRHDPDTPVFIMTAYGTIENAIDAIRRGAFHYFAKPLKSEEVLIYLARALTQRRSEISHRQLLKDAQDRYTFEAMVGRSPAMRRVFDIIERVASSPACVLIVGESGTGKELAARAIHFRGPRADKPFVPVNCAAIPETLIESELFGHESGAFTGAGKPRAGLAVEANGGTLFLDEVSELPLELQPKLLRLVQESEVRPVGSDKTRKVDVRILAATNIDLNEAVRAGRFRADLFYRLNVVPVEVPPLRERREDIPILAERLLQRALAANPRLGTPQLSSAAVEGLLEYDWPGNVRELENALERAATLCRGQVINAEDFGFLCRGSSGDPLTVSIRDLVSLRELETRYIEHVLDKSGGNKVKAAAVLGVDPSTLYRRHKAKGE